MIPSLGKHFAAIWGEDDSSKEKADKEDTPEKEPKKKKGRATTLLRMFRPKYDRQAADKISRKHLKDLEETLKPSRSFQGHSVAQRLIAALVPVSSPAKHQQVSAPVANLIADSPELKNLLSTSLSLDEKIRLELSDLGIEVRNSFELETRMDDIVSARIRASQSEYFPLSDESLPARKCLVANSSSLFDHGSKLKALESAENDLHKLFKKISAGKKVSEELMQSILNRCEKAKFEYSQLPPIGQTGTNFVDTALSGCPKGNVGFLLNIASNKF